MMYPLHQVIETAKAQGVTADFKLCDETWRALPYDIRHDKEGTIMAQQLHKGHYDRFTLDCLVEPVGVDMG